MERDLNKIKIDHLLDQFDAVGRHSLSLRLKLIDAVSSNQTPSIRLLEQIEEVNERESSILKNLTETLGIPAE